MGDSVDHLEDKLELASVGVGGYIRKVKGKIVKVEPHKRDIDIFEDHDSEFPSSKYFKNRENLDVPKMASAIKRAKKLTKNPKLRAELADAIYDGDDKKIAKLRKRIARESGHNVSKPMTKAEMMKRLTENPEARALRTMQTGLMLSNDEDNP